MAKQNDGWKSSISYKVGDVIESKTHGGKVIITGEGTSSLSMLGADGKLSRTGKVHTADSKTKVFITHFKGR